MAQQVNPRKEFRPIWLGGVKAYCSVVSVVVMLFAWWHVFSVMLSPKSPAVFTTFGHAMLSGLAFLVVWIYLLASKQAGKWFVDYWRRNVFGYNEVRYVTTASTIETAILKRGYVPSDYTFAIFLPLGGWFNRPHVRPDTLMNFWRVKYSRPFDGMVQLADETGSRMWMHIDELMKVVAACEPSMFKHWRFIVLSLWADAENRKKELAEAKMQIEAVRAENQDLRKEKADLELRIVKLGGDILGTVKRLEASKRFIKSKEGASIHKAIVSTITSYLESDSRWATLLPFWVFIRDPSKSANPGPEATKHA